MEDVFDALETSTKLFEHAGTEIRQLVEIVEGFRNLTNVPNAVRESAKIIRLLDVLIPKLTPANSICRTSSGEVITSLNSLANLVDDFSSETDPFFSTEKRQSLKSSAIIVHRVADFLDHVRKLAYKFTNICSRDKETNLEVITMFGDLMDDLALLYTAVGGVTAADEIKQQANFTRSVVVSLSDILIKGSICSSI